MRGRDGEEEAWAFVLAHRREVEAACRWYARTDGRLYEQADLVQDALLDTAEAHQGYDPARSAPVTWLSWRIRRARLRLLRRAGRPEAPQEDLGDRVAVGWWGSARQVEAQAELRCALDGDERAWEAAEGCLLSLTAEECRERYGVTRAALGLRLTAVGCRVTARRPGAGCHGLSRRVGGYCVGNRCAVD